MKRLLIILLVAFLAGCAVQQQAPKAEGMMEPERTGIPAEEMLSMDESQQKIATFAGGCFWCLEHAFEHYPGIIDAVSGFSGGDEPHPTYKQVSSGATGHREAVQITYDPAKVSYEELIEHFWRQIDPTDDGGQYVDRGFQYTSAIFYHDEEQRRIAEESKRRLEESGRFDAPIVTRILPFKSFYPAEDYHQDYAQKNPVRYAIYTGGSGRKEFQEEHWADEKEESAFKKPSDEELKEKLTPMQYKVTQEDGTEPPFENEYWDEKRDGIYVDIVSGEPLFSSKDKFDSGTGWPSFARPLEGGNIIRKRDFKLIIPRTEVRSKQADSHLGHVFSDGPEPTGLRYCINSAALRFIPKDDLGKEGYDEYFDLFE